MGLILLLILGALLGLGSAGVLCLGLERRQNARPVVVNGLQVPASLVQSVRKQGVTWAPRDGVYPLGARWKRHLQLWARVASLRWSESELDGLRSDVQRFAVGSD